jgi:hypothetical protein
LAGLVVACFFTFLRAAGEAAGWMLAVSFCDLAVVAGSLPAPDVPAAKDSPVNPARVAATSRVRIAGFMMVISLKAGPSADGPAATMQALA